jgi:type II secretory pathway pseudopilin PulG
MRFHRCDGQTLIELLIALTVIVTGLFAATTLVFSNLQLADRDADEVVAVNLAREGIELAKQVRDSNWLAGLPFNQGLGSAGDETATPRWGGSAPEQQPVFDFTANTMNDPQTRIWRSRNLATPLFFTHTDPSGVATPWRRLLTFRPMCETSCASDPVIAVRVESRVEWQRKGQTFQRVMYEDLYDWR